MEKYNEKDGVWRTIGGRRVFIKKGQSMSDAMKESGKFKSASKTKADTSNNVKEETTKKERTYEDVDKEWKEQASKMEKNYAEFGGNTAEDEKRLNELSAERDRLSSTKTPDEIKEIDNKKKYEEYVKENQSAGEKTRQLIQDSKVKTFADEIKEQEESSEKKEKFTPRAKGSKSFEEHGVAFEDYKTNERFSDYLRDKYGTDDIDIITTGSDKSAKSLRDEFNKKSYDEYVKETLNNEDYLRENNPNAYLSRIIDESKKKNEYTRQELKDKFGTDDVDLINAGKEKENRVSLKEDSKGQRVVGSRENNIEGSKIDKTDAIRLQMGQGISDDKLIDYANRNKSTNDTMNDAIRVKASRSSLYKSRPESKEIESQGTSNRKEVSNNIQAHILDYYDSPKDFVEQMEAMHEPNMWRAGEKIAQGGGYLIYNGDMSDFLNELKINPKGKNFSEDKAFDMYTSLIGRESARLYEKLKKEESQGRSFNDSLRRKAYEKYLKEHPASKLKFNEFVKNNEK